MKIAPNIYRTPRGFRVFVRVAPGSGGLKSRSFDRTATLTEMKQWREEQRVEHRKAPRAALERGTLAADAAHYLKLVATMPTFKDRERDINSWIAVYGARHRHGLTKQDYQLQLQEWKLRGKGGKPLAASTVNHRRTAIEHLYTTLDGEAAPNPLREISPFDEPPAEPRAIPMKDVRAILAAMPPSKTRARVKVLAWTGIRGRSELGKMKPEHVDLQRRQCWVPTGKKGKPRQLELNEDGIKAWREFIAAKAWGTYSKDSLRNSFRRAVKAVNAARKKAKQPLLPAGLRVYDLRHSIATALLEAGADLSDVQEHLGHTSPRMTRRYAPFQSAKLRQALRRL